MTEHQKDVVAGLCFAALVVGILGGGWLVIKLLVH